MDRTCSCADELVKGNNNKTHTQTDAWMHAVAQATPRAKQPVDPILVFTLSHSVLFLALKNSVIRR
jgi:hypothetical protein